MVTITKKTVATGVVAGLREYLVATGHEFTFARLISPDEFRALL